MGHSVLFLDVINKITSEEVNLYEDGLVLIMLEMSSQLKINLSSFLFYFLKNFPFSMK